VSQYLSQIGSVLLFYFYSSSIEWQSLWRLKFQSAKLSFTDNYLSVADGNRHVVEHCSKSIVSLDGLQIKAIGAVKLKVHHECCKTTAQFSENGGLKRHANFLRSNPFLL